MHNFSTPGVNLHLACSIGVSAPTTPPTEGFTDEPYRPRTRPTPGDRVFRGLCAAMASISLAIVLAIFWFLLDKSRSAFHHSGIINFFTKSYWLQYSGKFGVLGLLENTLLIALVALVVGVPVALALAVFINEYAPARARAVMTGTIDLLAAVPSIIFGLWGVWALEHGKPIQHLSRFFSEHFSVFPFFRVGPNATLGFSTFAAGLVVGIMIIPIVCSISRDVMAQVPREQCEGALALGGTKWGMVRDVILPFGRSGIIGAVILGLGRALGETIAILFIVSQITTVNTHILTSGSGSVASTIANYFDSATPLGESGLVAAGLALFILTFLVNLAARVVVSRGSSWV
jgi:phosphate transport system permease protein